MTDGSFSESHSTSHRTPPTETRRPALGRTPSSRHVRGADCYADDGTVDFFGALDALIAAHPIKIDRPKGSSHPRYPEVVYPLGYGYLDGTLAGDGHGIDLFRGTVAGKGLVGAYVSVDLGKADLEAKLLIDCSPAEVDLAGVFLRSAFGLAIHLIPRD